MSHTIIGYHGSPGTPLEFTELAFEFSLANFMAPNRNEGESPNLTQLKSKATLLSYSFGAVPLLLDAANNPDKVDKIILIAPFFFGGKKLSPVAKQVLKSPLIGNLILKKSAEKAIPLMLKNSAFPDQIPNSYQEYGEHYKNPSILLHALLEKEEIEKKINESITLLKKHKIPLIIIRGDSDQSASVKEQIDPLRELITKEYVIKKGGHALLWTHHQEISRHLKNEITLTKTPGAKLPPSIIRPFGYFDGEDTRNSVYEFLKKHLKESPKKPFLTWAPHELIGPWKENKMVGELSHKSVSAEELDICVDRIAYGFKKLGIQKGDRVIIFVPMSFLMYASMFALQKIGAIAVFLESWARRDQFKLILETSTPKALISVELAFNFLKEMPEVYSLIPQKICAGPSKMRYDAHIEDFISKLDFIFRRNKRLTKAEPVHSEHTALITFTTGSTGTPKGADRSHRFLAAQHYALNRHLPYQKSDIDLPVFPVFSLNNMAAGVNTIIPALDLSKLTDNDAPTLYYQLTKERVTCATLSPSLFNALSAYCKERGLLLTLRRIITGGAPVSRDDVREMKEVAPKAQILVLYGSTEVEPMAHIEGDEFINLKTRAMEDPEWADDGVNVGHFDKGLSVRFLKIHPDPIVIKSGADWDNLLIQKGKVGEIIVAGEHVCQGYYNNEDAFSRAKIKDEAGVIWHRTGDLGRIDERGDLWLVGRINNVIIRNGEYFFPVRAEIILKKLPFVDKAAYLGLPDERLGQKCVVVVTTKENRREGHYQDEIYRLFNKNGVPVDEIIFKESIPLDPRHHSKVEYSALIKEIMESR